MRDKFLRESVVNIIGKPNEMITDLLKNKKHVNEFIIAKKLDLTINQTRNLLYKLSDFGIVSSIRKKDKKKGWYTYYWKIENLKALEFLREIYLRKIEQLGNQIKSRETKQFYICERCNIEFNEESALLYDFTCNECGEIFTLKDNSKVLREFKKRMTSLQKEVDLISEEIKKEQEIAEKEIIKEIKKEEKEKKKKREAKKAERLAAKKKLAKKEEKEKKPAKKITKKKAAKKTKKKPVKKIKKSVSKKTSAKKSAIKKKATKKAPKKIKSSKKR